MTTLSAAAQQEFDHWIKGPAPVSGHTYDEERFASSVLGCVMRGDGPREITELIEAEGHNEQIALRYNAMYRMAMEMHRQMRQRATEFEFEPEDLEQARTGQTSITNSVYL